MEFKKNWNLSSKYEKTWIKPPLPNMELFFNLNDKDPATKNIMLALGNPKYISTPNCSS